MRTIEITNPHRRRHFEFFREMNHPHFNVCANVEVGPWLAAARRHTLKTTPAIVFLLTKVANEIQELRQRIHGEELVEHDVVHPSFTVRTSASDVFMYHPHDSVPRITRGKFFSTSKGRAMPLSVQVHHAVVDGVHVGHFFQRVEEVASSPHISP